MEVSNQTLLKTFNNANCYTIPLFQRHYSWNKDSWERLWEDILELRDVEKKGSSHFMGTLVFVPESKRTDNSTYQVIDGQQRLTTLSLLLCAIRNHAKELKNEKLAAKININYLVHQFEEGSNHFRVYPRHRDRIDFENAILGEEVAEGRIKKALDYFRSALSKDEESQTVDGLNVFFNEIVTKLNFVHITLNDESPYRIFSSLNSTGVDLTEADLIRNFMFMHVESDKQDEFDRKQWEPFEKRFSKKLDSKDAQPSSEIDNKELSGFFRDFLMQEGKYIGPVATFETFEERYSKSTFNPNALVKELAKDADIYDAVRGQSQHPSKKVSKALEKLRDVKMTTAYPLALNLLKRHADSEIDEGDLVTCIELITSFIFRRYMCGESSRAYGLWFVVACKTLGDDVVFELSQYLNDKIFPRDDIFRERFQTFNLNKVNSSYSRAVLKWLEMRHKNYSNNEKIVLSDKQIQLEHIMPQNLSLQWKRDLGDGYQEVHDKWLHTVGNLTLTGYNQDYGNRSFEDKCNGGWIASNGNKVHGYKGSSIAITKELSEHEYWGQSQIEERGKELADLAVKIWISPKLNSE